MNDVETGKQKKVEQQDDKGRKQNGKRKQGLNTDEKRKE